MIVGILIFDQVEVLDVTGPFEVFSVTRLNENRRREESSPFEVTPSFRKYRSGHCSRWTYIYT